MSRPPTEARLRDLWPHLLPYRRRVALAIAIGLLAAAATLVQPLLVSDVVDKVDTGLSVATLIILGVFFVVGIVLGALRQVILERCSEDFVLAIRARLVDHVARLPIGTINRSAQGDLVSRVVTDTNTLRGLLSQGIVDILISAASVAVSLVMMAVLDPLLTSVVIGALLVVVLAMAGITRRSRPASFALQTVLGRLSGVVAGMIRSLPLIRSSVATEQEVTRVISVADEARGVGYKLVWLRAIAGSFSGVAVQVLLLTVVGVGALRVASGATSIGDMSAFLMYTMMVTAPIAAVAGVLTRFSEALGAFGRVAQVLDQPQERQVEAIAARSSRAGRIDLAFEFDDVTFVHEGTERPSVDGLTLAIPARQFTAIVGPSGAGKSTLFHLLERFYDATSGSLRFFGDDVRRIERDAVRRRVAYVEQGGPVVPGTVGDNLRIGRPDLTDENCVQALLAVNLAASVEDAQQHLTRQVGEGGALMSGGERQRLAVARALLRRSDVILLDEATSSLDSANEHIVQDALAAAGRNRTLVVIAHRLSTVVAADNIAVIEEGKLVAFGPHEVLLESSNLYRDLAARQLLHTPG